jgi:hypothetical protein
MMGWGRCQGRPTAFDVTVTSPLQQACLRKTIEDANFALTRASDFKRGKCRQVCADRGLGFIPLAVTTFGAWDADAASNLKEMAKLQATNSGREMGKCVKHAFEKLAICLQRGNGNLLFARSPTPNVPPDIDGHQ